jgi:hypothetical protein
MSAGWVSRMCYCPASGVKGGILGGLYLTIALARLTMLVQFALTGDGS